MSDNDDAQEQARRQGHGHTTLIDEKELEGQGVPPPPAGVELPPVDGQITLDDDDAGVCRFATKDEIRDLYVDNPVTASPVQPDVWTLDVDNQSVTWVIEAYRSQAGNLSNSRNQPRLNQKEMLIIAGITQGKRNKEIAYQLGTTEQVVKNYLRKIYDKLGVSDRLELALYCLHHQLHKNAGEAETRPVEIAAQP